MVLCGLTRQRSKRRATLTGPYPATRARTVLVPWKLKDVHEWNIPQSSVEADEEKEVN